MKEIRYLARCRRCGQMNSTLVRGNPAYLAWPRGSEAFAGAQRAGHNAGALVYDETGESGAFGNLAIRCHGCGKLAKAIPVRGRYSSKVDCNAKCHVSKSGICECSCAGKNHGKAYER